MKISQDELQRRLGKGNLLSKIKTSDSSFSSKDQKQDQKQDSSDSKQSKGNDADNKLNAGRKADVPNAPKSLRVVAGIAAKLDNGVIAAQEFGLTTGQTRYAAKNVDTELTTKKVQGVALSRLMDSLGLLDEITISGEKPKDIAAIAANLSRVHRNLAPEKNNNEGNQVNITIYSPKQKLEKDYDVIEVKTGTY